MAGLIKPSDAWVAPQISSPYGQEFPPLAPCLVVLIPERAPHFGRSDNFSHYEPDFVIPKMAYAVNHLLKNPSLEMCLISQ